jgi:hypothetical protein
MFRLRNQRLLGEFSRAPTGRQSRPASALLLVARQPARTPMASSTAAGMDAGRDASMIGMKGLID